MTYWEKTLSDSIIMNPHLYMTSLKFKSSFAELLSYKNEWNYTLRLTVASAFQLSASDKLTTTC